MKGNEKMQYKKPRYPECEIIAYLINEIIKEKEYNRLYEVERELCKKKAAANGGNWWDYIDLKAFPHEPRKSVIEDNKKLIRRLALKI